MRALRSRLSSVYRENKVGTQFISRLLLSLRGMGAITYPRLLQQGQFGAEIVGYSLVGAGQGKSSDQQNGQHDVGKSCRDPHNLSCWRNCPNQLILLPLTRACGEKLA